MKISYSRIGYWTVFLVIASYAFFRLQGPKGVPALLAKQRAIEMMEKRNATLAQGNERTREHIERLSDNPAVQELEIRQRLKLVRPGEKVYILNSK